MNHKTSMVFGTIILGGAITGYYLSSEPKAAEVLISQDVSEVIVGKQKIIVHALEKKEEGIIQKQGSSVINSKNKMLLDIIDSHPTLKMHIQGTGWYLAIIQGTIPFEQGEIYVRDALLIEDEIERHPEILNRLQESSLWEKYTQGEIPPNNIIYGEIPAIRYIDTFKTEHNDVLEKISKNPLFNNTEKGESTAYSDQKSLIEVAMTNVDFLQKNPEIIQKLTQYGYKVDDIYISRFDTQSGIYWEKDAVMALSKQTDYYPEVWDQFWSSETGALYRSNKITPREAYSYINQLMVEYTPR